MGLIRKECTEFDKEMVLLQLLFSLRISLQLFNPYFHAFPPEVKIISNSWSFFFQIPLGRFFSPSLFLSWGIKAKTAWRTQEQRSRLILFSTYYFSLRLFKRELFFYLEIISWANHYSKIFFCWVIPPLTVLNFFSLVWINLMKSKTLCTPAHQSFSPRSQHTHSLLSNCWSFFPLAWHFSTQEATLSSVNLIISLSAPSCRAFIIKYC